MIYLLVIIIQPTRVIARLDTTKTGHNAKHYEAGKGYYEGNSDNWREGLLNEVFPMKIN